MDFQNKVVIVTGASSGIGASIALEFSKHRADVVIVGRNENKLSDVMKKCVESGNTPLMILADVTKDAEIRKIVDDTLNRYGKIDVVVNNAGRGAFEGILSNEAIETFDSVMAVNLRAAVCLSHYTLPHLIITKGNIINISSAASVAVLSPLSFSYCASKSGLDHFTRSIALELAPKGVRVNSVNPGPVKTDIIKSDNPDDEEVKKKWHRITKATALGKLAESNEIAEMVLYLASDKAKSITGSFFMIDNGISLKTRIMTEM